MFYAFKCLYLVGEHDLLVGKHDLAVVGFEVVLCLPLGVVRNGGTKLCGFAQVTSFFWAKILWTDPNESQ
jgi:hypothetical protein